MIFDLKAAAAFLNYHSLGESDGYFTDFGGLDTRDWFHVNHEKFLFPLDAICDASKPYGDAPCGCGIYFLFMDDCLQYVGLSVRISERMHQHMKKEALFGGKWFNRYTAIWVPEYLMNDVENYYIHAFNPPCNDQILSVAHSMRRYLVAQNI